MLRWHGEGHKKGTMLRHPTDGSDWWTVNTMCYRNIGGEVRYLWFGLSTDGMNPFDQVRSNHSTWSVTLCIYNLPPWLYMKRSYLQMLLLIQGPRQPGNDIDVFLELVIDELVEMCWKGCAGCLGRVQKGTCHDQGSTYRYNHQPTRSRFVVQREDKRLY